MAPVLPVRVVLSTRSPATVRRLRVLSWSNVEWMVPLTARAAIEEFTVGLESRALYLKVATARALYP